MKFFKDEVSDAPKETQTYATVAAEEDKASIIPDCKESPHPEEKSETLDQTETDVNTPTEEKSETLDQTETDVNISTEEKSETLDQTETYVNIPTEEKSESLDQIGNSDPSCRTPETTESEQMKNSQENTDLIGKDAMNSDETELSEIKIWMNKKSIMLENTFITCVA